MTLWFLLKKKQICDFQYGSCVTFRWRETNLKVTHFFLWLSNRWHSDYIKILRITFLLFMVWMIILVQPFCTQGVTFSFLEETKYPSPCSESLQQTLSPPCRGPHRTSGGPIKGHRTRRTGRHRSVLSNQPNVQRSVPGKKTFTPVALLFPGKLYRLTHDGGWAWCPHRGHG